MGGAFRECMGCVQDAWEGALGEHMGFMGSAWGVHRRCIGGAGGLYGCKEGVQRVHGRCKG